MENETIDRNCNNPPNKTIGNNCIDFIISSIAYSLINDEYYDDQENNTMSVNVEEL